MVERGDLGGGVVILGEPELGQEGWRQQNGGTAHRHDEPWRNLAETVPPVPGEERDHRDEQSENGEQADRTVAVDEQRHDQYQQERDPLIPHQVEAPVQQPGHDHHGGELWEIAAGEPIGEDVVREEKPEGPDDLQQPAFRDHLEGASHPVGADCKEYGHRHRQRLLEVATQEYEDETGDVEKRLLIEEENGAAQGETVRRRPDWEKVEVPEMGGVQ